MNGQTLLLAIVSAGLLAGLLAYCPAPRAFVVSADSLHYAVATYQDSTAECRILAHADYGMMASCWPRRVLIETGKP
jgi:hypothetical protein